LSAPRLVRVNTSTRSPPWRREKIDQRRQLGGTINVQNALVDPFGRGCDRRDRDARRMLQELVGEFCDRAWHGGGKQQRLPRRRQLGDDVTNVGHEAHVKHAVSLVEHQGLDPIEPQGTALHEVDQPPWGCDQDIDTGAEPAHLSADRDTPDGKRRLKS
jgi:hypothetical protein